MFLFDNAGFAHLVSNGERIPVRVTEIHTAFGEAPEFKGHFCGLDYARGGVIPVEKSPIKNVIFNDPATVVIWNDGTKTVVKCQPGDTYSKETGLALCIAKKYLGNKGNFNEVFKKWIPEETEPVEKVEEISVEEMRNRLEARCNAFDDCEGMTDGEKCPLANHACTCNFLLSHCRPMTDDEIRAAFKIAYK